LKDDFQLLRPRFTVVNIELDLNIYKLLEHIII
jgi:hypothetical protein